MNRLTLAACLAAAAVAPLHADGWKPAGNHIRTPWADQLTVENAHREYPRPQMIRPDWKCLNGLWDYAITPSGTSAPAQWDGEILVPFAVESSLSGVGKSLGKDQRLWYRTTFDVPRSWKGKRVLLHFGAVDWQADVWVNDILIGSHKGGYTGFSFDVTPYLNAKGPQQLAVRVYDPTDQCWQPRGKQVSTPKGIWYTPVSGIWQSVWMEPVAEGSVVRYDVHHTPDGKEMEVSVLTDRAREGDILRIRLLEGKEGYDTSAPSDRVIAEAKAIPGAPVSLTVPQVHFWSPDSPYLYGLEIALLRGGKEIDKVQGYTGIRTISVYKDKDYYKRMALNGKPLFHYGPLDQGWWPDGLYTAPSDEAMKFDLLKTKQWGFNMIRKHIKVEPDRWFYYCDQLGILVWQDMPSTNNGHIDHVGNHNNWGRKFIGDGEDAPIPVEWKENFYREWEEIVLSHTNFPCIVVWVPFNEAWGQFDTRAVVDFTRQLDGSRLINMSSGGNWEENCGDILDSHNYPHPSFRVFSTNQVNVVGEYGGIGLPLKGHIWSEERNWDYSHGKYKNAREVTDAYVEYAKMMEALVDRGCAAAVYTQTTDVEIEINGLMTYDRKVMKVEEDRIREANQSVIRAMSVKTPLPPKKKK